MTRHILAVATALVMTSGPAFGQDARPSPQTLARNWNVCLWQKAYRLDDHTSPADVIAQRIAEECHAEDAAEEWQWKTSCAAILQDDPTSTAARQIYNGCVADLQASLRGHRIELVLKERAWNARHPGQEPPASPYAPCDRPDGLCGLLEP
jgi:hypothetical protein